MDPSAFDTLVRSIARSGTRRRLLAGLPLLGTLAVVGEDEAAAQRPLDRLQQRTTQRNRKQRNNNQNNNNNNNNNNQNNGGGGGGGGNNNGGGGGGGLRTPNATCTCCPGTQVYYPDANVCCSPGQEGVAGNCCPPANICNNNQGQPVCCQHRCMSGVCCPCDNVASCQQCVVDVRTKQASCQTYCPAGQICTAAGCLPG
jgi:hypothetical protein